MTFRTPEVDLRWVPQDAPVIIVQNDELVPVVLGHNRPRVIAGHGNVGFGGGVNRALPEVTTTRTILVNPDVVARPEHWDALTNASDDEVVTVELHDGDGRATTVVSGYPTPFRALLTSWRVGRIFARGSGMRSLVGRLMPSVGATGDSVGSLPLRHAWPSGAFVSYPTAALRSIGGFDEGYFLYLEDTDVAERLATAAPHLRLRMSHPPASHAVHGSSHGRPAARTRDLAYARSWVRYARGRPGPLWRIVRPLLSARVRWLERGGFAA